MQTSKRSELRVKRPMKMGVKLPFGITKNPFKAETKLASAGFEMMKKGAGFYLKLRF